MKNFLVCILMTSALLAASQAGAAETAVDFRAGLNGYTISGTTGATLVANATFTNVDMASLGSYSFEYVIHDCNNPANLVFDGTLTIVNGQARVAMGTQKTGRFVLSYDVTTQKLVAKFTLDNAIPCYNVVGNSSLGSDAWSGQIEVIRNHIVF